MVPIVFTTALVRTTARVMLNLGHVTVQHRASLEYHVKWVRFIKRYSFSAYLYNMAFDIHCI